MKLAIIDLGSNSFHLLIAEPQAGGGFVREHAEQIMVRLGARTLRSGTIDQEAWEAGLYAIDTLVRIARARGAERIVAVATSALREADNGRAFAGDVASRHGFDVEILDDHDEARLIHLGVTSGLPASVGRIAVVDLGGGSVSMAVGERQEVLLTRCLPLGVLRLRESVVPDSGHVNDRTAQSIADLVRATAWGAVRDVRQQAPEAVVFASGTARTLARLAREMAPNGVPPERLTAEALARLIRILAKFRPSALTALGVEEGRVDTIAPGAVVMLTLTEMLGFPTVTVSGRALREGVAWREAQRVRSWPAELSHHHSGA